MSAQPYLGSITLFAGSFAPSGYALCQGQLLSISTYSALFAILGTTFGGDGVQTFGLPNLQGRRPVGAGSGRNLAPVQLGEFAGAELATVLNSNMPVHTHQVMVDTNTANTTGYTPKTSFLGAQASPQSGGTGTPLFSPGPPSGTMAPQSVSIAGGSIPFELRNPYLGMNFIICLEGIFPSRN